MVENLLNIEHFFTKNPFKIKTKKYSGIWGHSWYNWKALSM